MAKDDPIPIDDQTLSLRQIIDSAPALIHTGWTDGHRDFLDQTWLRYGRRSPEDLQGWEWTALVHPEDVEGIVEKWRESPTSGEPLLHEARILPADGEYRWMLSHKLALLSRRDEEFVLYGGEHSNQPGPPSVPLLASTSMRPALDTSQRSVVCAVPDDRSN
jgi:PAS domain-containing protein